MKKHFLVVDNNVFNRTAFALKDELTIGTGKECDICIDDEKAAPLHARVRLQHGHASVEDMGSGSGTFLNDHRIDENTIILEGDRIRCGRVVFMLLHDIAIKAAADSNGSDSQKPAEFMSLQKIGPSLNIARLEKLIPNIPLFADIGSGAVRQLVQNARLLFYEAGQVVFFQGDTGKSIFIILDGKIEVFFKDNRGRHIQVAILGENQIFGEMAFLTGESRSSSVRAVEVCYLCELQPESVQNIILEHPSVKKTIQVYYQNRLKELSEKKSRAGFSEKRQCPRYNMTLPVKIEICPDQSSEQNLHGKEFRLLTKDISLSGLNVRLNGVYNMALTRLPVGHPLKVVITPPPPFKKIESQASVARANSDVQRLYGLVGIKFDNLADDQKETLNLLLR